MKKRILGMILLSAFLIGCANHIEDGVALLEAENYKEAIAVFEKDIEKEKNLDEAYRGIGIAYFEMEQYEEAAEYLKLALKEETKETASIFGILGACYMHTEQYEDALEAYEKALKAEGITDELKQEIRYNMIALYERMGDWDAANKQAQKYIKDYPDDARVNKEAEFLETR